LLNRIKYYTENYPTRYFYLYYRFIKDCLILRAKERNVTWQPNFNACDKWYILGSGPSLNEFVGSTFQDGNVIALTTSAFFPCRKDIVLWESLDPLKLPIFGIEMEKCLKNMMVNLDREHLPTHFFLTNYKDDRKQLQIPVDLNASWIQEFPWLSQNEVIFKKDLKYFFKSWMFKRYLFKVRGSFSRAIFMAIQNGAKEIILIGFDGVSRQYFYHDKRHGNALSGLKKAHDLELADVTFTPHRSTLPSLGPMTLENFITILRQEFPGVEISKSS
jgi:hypothetical protein